MSEKPISFEVPAGLEAEAVAFANILRDQHGPDQDEVMVIEADTRGLVSEVVVPALMLLPSTVLTSLTKSWIDECVWPELKKRMDDPSRRFVSWLLDTLLPSSTSGGDGERRDQDG